MKSSDRPIVRPLDCPTVQPPDRPTGFTLVEMLVVVLIVAVLIGITVKILGGAGRQAAKAVTVNRMERLKHAIEEYYTEYGQYPPTQSFAYEYPSTNGNFIGDVADAFDMNQGTNIARETIFSFGLMSFLLPRVNDDVAGILADRGNPNGIFDGPQWRNYNEYNADLQRALDAMRRWRPFLDGPPDQIWSEHIGSTNFARGIAVLAYTNRHITVTDGWGNSFLYASRAPYQTYQLWSLGPDPDNTNTYIYGHVGH